jgi:PAS domain S-box-containing protein
MEGVDRSAHRHPGDEVIKQLIAGMVEIQFQSFLADLPDPMLGVDRHGIVRFANPQAERLFTRPRAELLGRQCDELIRDPAAAGPERPSEWHETLLNGSLRAMGSTLELAAVRSGGSEVPVEVTLSLVGTEDGLWLIAAIRDVTRRKRAEEAMAAQEEAVRAARDAALETSRLKSQFLANMSHEIRTPMNGVLGLAHLLLKTRLDAQQRRYLLALHDSAQNLLQIINDILDLSKVEAGKLELESVEFDLRQEVQAIIDLLSSGARDKGLALSLQVLWQVPETVSGDPIRLRQVLMNLVGNAIKFTDEGEVRIRVRPGLDGRLRFEVSDTGIGIDPAARPSLLDPFTQADASTTRRFGGTGLGLAISRQLIELMGGFLDYESEVGTGSIFWFEIPLRQPAAASARAALSGPRAPDRPGAGAAPRAPDRPGAAGGPAAMSPAVRLDPRLLRGLPEGVFAEVPRLPAAALPGGRPVLDGAARRSPDRALVVDDSPINQLVAKDLLEGMGFTVDVVASGKEAIGAAAACSYDLILMDCLMPIMDGFEATRQIRLGEEPGRRTPIVAITAAAMDGDRERCLGAGMDDYVTKPVTPQLFAAAVSRYCRAPAPR